MLSTLYFCKFAGVGQKEQLDDGHLPCLLTHWCGLSLEAGGLEILLTLTSDSDLERGVHGRGGEAVAQG